MHNELELTFPNALILLVGLATTYWIARAPKSVLKLMSNRYRGIGLDGDRPGLAAIVRNFGRFSFFMLVEGMLTMIAPHSVSEWRWFSLLTLVLALGISVFALRNSSKSVTAPSSPERATQGRVIR